MSTSSTPFIVDGAKFDPTLAEFSKVRTNKNTGAKSVPVFYDSKGYLYVQTPPMNIPFGLQKPYSERDGTKPSNESESNSKDEFKKYTLEFSFTGRENNKKMQQFYNNFEKFDKIAIEQCVKNGEVWMQDDELDKKMAKKMYTPMVRPALDKNKKPADYPPRLRAKVNYRNGEFDVNVFDNEKNKVETPLDQLNLGGCTAIAILKCQGVWLQKTGFGITWQLVRLRLQKRESLEAYPFLDNEVEDSDEESDNDASGDEEPEVKDSSSDGGNSDKEASDQEDSDQEDSDVEREPTPPPEPKKTTRRRKKAPDS